MPTCRTQIGDNGLARILQRRLNRLTLRHAAGELRHVSDVAVVFRVENRVHEKLSCLGHVEILQQRRQRGLPIYFCWSAMQP